MSSRTWPRGLTVVALCWLMNACGQKGPPLAPLHLVPAGVAEPVARRIGDLVRLRFALPNRNENGPGPLELDRVEIYAMTVGPDGEPSAGEVMSTEHLIGQIAVRPVLEEGEPQPPDEKRPAPGSPVTFDEQLTAAALKPEPVKKPVKPAAAPVTTPPLTPATTPPPTTPPATAPPATAPPPTPTPATAATPPAAGPPGTPPAAAAPGSPAAVAPKVRTYVRRIYMARGMTRSGRPGTASAPMEVPLVDLPAPPKDPKPRVTQSAVVVEWTAAGEPTGYNIYGAGDLTRPLNSAPLTAPTFEHAGAAFGQEYCYRVRAVAVVDSISLEGEPSPPVCVTPRDTFPPAAPRGLAAVPTAGQINLIWDANTEKDLAGYLVLRGPAPDGPLEAITAAPIRDTSYRDATVKPGTRYVYAVVAVDAATPVNLSPQSARVEETAR